MLIYTIGPARYIKLLFQTRRLYQFGNSHRVLIIIQQIIIVDIYVGFFYTT